MRALGHDTTGTRNHRRTRGRIARIASVALLSLVLPLAAPASAAAAGDGVLSISIDPVDVTTGAAQAWAGSTALNASTRLGYRISYSCSNADCLNAEIQISPAPTDPTHGVYRHLNYYGWTAPFVGATISGSKAAGYTINLGNLTEGRGGTFQVNYQWDLAGNASSDSIREAQFFPNGFQIVMSATATSDTIANTPQATAAGVEWRSSIREPSLAHSNPGARDSGVNVTYSINMDSGCLPIRDTAPKGDSRFTCGKSHVVTEYLDPRATFVSASHSGVYDASAHTVTWTQGVNSARNSPAAAGWYRIGHSDKYVTRTIVVTYPPEAFSDSGTDTDYCNFTEQVETRVELSMVYLGAGGPADDTNVRTKSVTQRHNVSCVKPFGKGRMTKLSTYDGTTRTNNSTVSPVVVQPDADQNRHNWVFEIGNQGNVTGVGVVNDPDLAIEGTRPDTITVRTSAGATMTGAQIDYTLNDATTGSASGTVTAPDGKWFTAMTVTTAPLTGPNLYSTGTASTNAQVVVGYAITGDAPVGQTRTNTATGTMTYPDEPTVSDVALGPVTHSLSYVAPFGRGSLLKNSTNSGTANRINIPTSGSASHYWSLVARNTANVPGVPILVDENLDAGPVQVRTVTQTASGGVTASGTLEYTLNTGATGTVALPFTAPTGTWITAVRVTGPTMNPAVLTTSQTPSAWPTYEVRLGYAVPSTTEAGSWTNTASLTMTYPNMGLADVDAGSATTTVVYGDAPVDTRPRIGVTLASVEVEGGGSPVPGRDVTYVFRGSSSNVDSAATFSPQYVFIAPEGWTIVPGSAVFATGGVPSGVQFEYRTVEIAGVEREMVVASWPSNAEFGVNTSWPNLTVRAQPTTAAPAGSSGTADIRVGEATNNWSTSDAVYTDGVADTADVDGDGSTTEGFARVTRALTVGASAGVRVIKEICYPDASG
jgi:hypothetical protein